MASYDNGGGVPPFDPVLGSHVRPVDEQEVVKAVRDYFGRRCLAEGTEGRVVQAYEQFMDALRGLDLDMAGDVMEHLAPHTVRSQEDGEWISDPAAIMTDGHMFGDTIQAAGGGDVRVSVCIDVSGSMLTADGLEISVIRNPNGRGTISQTGLNLEGAKNPVLAAPRLFYATLVGRYLLRSLERAQAQTAGRLSVAGYRWAQGRNGTGVGAYGGEVIMWDPNAGEDTVLYSLLQRIHEDEQKLSDPNVARLDLIVTDGVLSERDNPLAQESVERLQEERRARGPLAEIILNLQPPSNYNADRNWRPKGSQHVFVESPAALASIMRRACHEFFQRL